MKKSMIVLIGVLAVLAIGVISFIGSYNSLVTMDEDVNSASSSIDTQLQRRADLIPNLVATVQQYADHEEEIFTAVADARSRLIGANNMGDKAEANQELDSALGRLLAISENYPELQANENFINLQDELAGTENRIATARRDYNTTVKTFNSRIRKFPTVLLANIAGFNAYDYFEAAEGAEENPDVGDLFDK